jgi:O-antigen/teichoic acid export membrane protein
MNPEVKVVDLKAKAVKGAGINVTTQFIIIVFQTLGVIVLARLLTPKDFGLVAMVTAFSQWLMNFGVNGFTEYIIQKQDLRINIVNSIFWIHVFLAVFLALIFTIFGLFLVNFYTEPALSRIAVAMAIGFIFYALFTSQLALLKREMKFNLTAMIELIAAILSIVFAVTAAMVGMGYWAVVIRQLTIPFVIMIAVWLISPWRPGFPRHLSTAFPGLRFAFQVYCNFSLDYLMRNIDKVLLGKFHGAVILGNYDRAYYLSSMPAGQLLGPLHGVALSTLSRLRDDRERYYIYYTKAVSMIAFLGTIMAAVLTLSAKDLILLLLGPAWADAGLVVMAFSPGIAAALVYGTNPWLHLSLGTPNRWLRWNLFSAVLTVTAFIIAAPFGAVAMAIAYSAITYVLVLPGLWYAGRPIQFGLKGVISSIWPYFASAISVCILWLYLSAHWLLLKGFLTALSPISRIVITSLIAFFLYIIMVIILQRNLSSIRETSSFLKIMLSRKES